MKRCFWIASGITCALGIWTATLAADTLILRNGTRISGRLVGWRAGVFECEEDRGNRRRVIRVEQVEVRTVELDEDGPGAFGNSDTPAGRPRARIRPGTSSRRTPAARHRWRRSPGRDRRTSVKQPARCRQT